MEKRTSDHWFPKTRKPQLEAALIEMEKELGCSPAYRIEFIEEGQYLKMRISHEVNPVFMFQFGMFYSDQLKK